MKKPDARLASRIDQAMRPAAAIGAALAVPWALANTGDLDPGFASLGRLVSIPDAVGSARSVELLDDGSAFVAGGDLQLECGFFCYYYNYDFDYQAFNFIDHISSDGTIDPNFDAAQLTDTEVFDAILQPDQKLVAVGREVSFSNFDPHLVVFRLESSGALDASFGAGGKVVLRDANFGNVNEAHAVTIDSKNRIVVTGEREGALFVVRFLADGTLDNSFGNGGAYFDAATTFDPGWKILPAPSGGYRVLTAGQSCQIVGLTGSGELDAAFGVSGVVTLADLPGGGSGCGSLALDATGRLLATGASESGGFALRLLASGAIDGSFVADPAVASSVFQAAAISAADDGKILLAGTGINGSVIMRLQANGTLDPLFGNNGQTWIDLPSQEGSYPYIEDLATDANGAVVAAGRNVSKPFLIKLVGDAGGDSPGVLGVSRPYYEVSEHDGNAVINVRRTGGSAGQVSVHYTTSTGDSATSDQDFGAVHGVLTWSDGDAAEKQVVVPIVADSEPPEEAESFRLLLNTFQGGAGFGTRSALVGVQPDGSPSGQFALYDAGQVTEPSVLEFYVYRNFYYSGAVSVTVTPVSGTAIAGEDFTATPITLNWGDQDSEAKLVQIPILDDGSEEDDETFSVILSNPTGGAIVGPNASTSVTIQANDLPVIPPPPPPPPSKRGGGGAIDYGLLGFLGLLAGLRRSKSRK